MTGEVTGAADVAGATEGAEEFSGAKTPPRRTPDESTVGLACSAEPVPSREGDTDFCRLQPGESLAGRFTILRFIAQGGMGAVYEAKDVMLRSQVALKVIRSRIATDATAMERFRREVLLARRVGHPNVCHVYELYEATTAAGVPIHFLTMEMLEGETLTRRIARQGRLTTAEALPLVRQMCAGLAAAHAEGVIHRDFKSSNVMLVPHEVASPDSTAPSIRVALTDFGIARAARLADSQPPDGPLTGGAAILGTPEYMAPEQVTGGAVTPATDIYALGVVLYEMVTGNLPFTGDTPLAAASKRLDEAPARPESLAPGLDLRWSAAVLRCLAREPEHRFKSALQIPAALERPPRRWLRLVGRACLVLALALAPFALARFLESLRHPPPRTAAVAAPRPVLAILGFRDELASPELSWLPTALSESLGKDLAAAETSLRVIPGDRVSDVRRSLGVSEEAVAEGRARERMQGLLAANVLVYGTLEPIAPGSPSVGLSVHMVDAVSGQALASFEEDLGEGAGGLADTVSRVADRLRQTLGVSLTQEQSAALSASRQPNLAATRFYALGVMSLRHFEVAAAKGYFDAALASDASFLDAQRRVVELWEHEGNRKRAREAAERIRLRPAALTPRQLAELDARILSLGPDPGKGSGARRALFETTPDDVELGLNLASREKYAAPKTASALLDRLRALPAPASGDIRIDLEAAYLAWRTNPQHAEQLLERATARAQALGARMEMAQALVLKSHALSVVEGRFGDGMRQLQEAENLVGKDGALLDEFATVKGWQANLAEHVLPTSAVLKTLGDTAALFRKLGDRDSLRGVLAMEAWERLQSGDYHLAATRLREVSGESEAIGQPPPFPYYNVKFGLAMTGADMEGVREAIRLMRTTQSSTDWALPLESDAFREQDRLAESRETLEKHRTLMETTGRREWALQAQESLCVLACDEGRRRDGLDCYDQLAHSAQHETKIRIAHCRYLAGDLQGAEKAAVETRAAAQHWGLSFEPVLANTVIMRVRAARGETAKAIASLRSDLAKADSNGNKFTAFEVALALGEVELRAGRPEGRPRLLKLEQEAKSKEFFRIARLAREALGAKPAARGTAP